MSEKQSTTRHRNFGICRLRGMQGQIQDMLSNDHLSLSEYHEQGLTACHDYFETIINHIKDLYDKKTS